MKWKIKREPYMGVTYYYVYENNGSWLFPWDCVGCFMSLERAEQEIERIKNLQDTAGEFPKYYG